MIRGMACTMLYVAGAVAAFGQAAAQGPAFEVASIRPADPQTEGRIMVRMGGDPGRVDYNNITLQDVLRQACKVKRQQIIGPSWLESDRFNIVAKLPEGASSDQVPEMLLNLLVERFKMAYHREKREMPVYTLTVGKSGPKLEKAEDDPGAAAPAAGAGPGPGRRGGMIQISNGHIEAKKITISGLADMLSNMFDRPVLDRTEIQGTYNITLDVAMEDLAMMRGAVRVMAGGPGAGGPEGPRPDGSPAPESAPAPSIFSAIQKLGLKLEPRKESLDFIIIDGINKVPTEN